MENLDYRKAFDKYFTIKRYPEPSNYIALSDGVSEEALKSAKEQDLEVHDLRTHPIKDLRNELRKYMFSALLGRGKMDDEFIRQIADESEKGKNIFWMLRDHGAGFISRLGNGVDMDSKKAFESGIIVERTPRANALSVRIWQDLQLLLMLSVNRGDAMKNNPVFLDNKGIKEKNIQKKYSWNFEKLNEAVNPQSLDFEDFGPSVLDHGEYLQDSKVAILGLGMIGREVIAKSPFLRLANIYGYDPEQIELADDRVKTVSSKEEALKDAEVLLLHMSGRKEEIGEKELNLLKKGAIICNNARGAIINPKALYFALQSEQISQAALDTHYIEDQDLLEYEKWEESEKKEMARYAVKLRNHPHVIASNHSAANEVHTQAINARDGVESAHLFNKYGTIVNPIAAPEIDFPYDGFLQPRSGILMPRKDVEKYRLATMLLHNGKIPGLIKKVREALSHELFDGKDINVKSTILRPGIDEEVAISFDAYDLPEYYRDRIDELLPCELNRQIESIRGAILAYTFKVEPR